MLSLKRLFSVVAVALFVILAPAPYAVAAGQPAPPDSTAGDTPPSNPPGADATGGLPTEGDARPPLLAPAAPPVRTEDPPPDGGVPGWLWAVLALLCGTGVAVAVSLWRGSRGPANADPLLESTAELVAVGRRQVPAVRSGAGEDRWSQSGRARR